MAHKPTYNLLPLLSGLFLIMSVLLSTCQPATPSPLPDFISTSPSVESETSPGSWTPLPPPALRFENLSVEDGLAHSEIGAITQDHLGFLWFATQNGLNKYDGYQFTTYRHDPKDDDSLRDSFIESLFVASDNTLWVGTQDGILERFDPASETFTHHELGSHNYAIAEDAEGSLWIGTRDPGLIRFDPQSGEAEAVWSAQRIMGVCVDKSGSIWAASPDEGIAQYNSSTEELTIHSMEHSVHDLLLDNDGTLWLSTWGNGLMRWNMDQDKAIRETRAQVGDYVSALHQGEDGTLWVGTYAEGLFHYDPNAGILGHYTHDPTNRYSLGPQGINAIFEDQSGVLWVGSGVGGGVYKLAIDADRFGHFRPIVDDPYSLSSGLVTSISGDREGNVYFGTFTGLNHWDQNTGLWRNYRNDPEDTDSLIHNTVRSVYLDSAGVLWIGTEGGLERFNPRINGFDHLGGPVVMWMHEGPSGRFWMATKDGFFEYDRLQEHFILIDEGYAWKIMVLEDDKGRVWVGSSGDGAMLYDPETGLWGTIVPNPMDPSSLSDDFVETIHQDRNGVIWIGTANGLNRFDEESGGFSHYSISEGLLDDRIAGILEDDQGYLWLATNSGLSRFDPTTETFENFTVRDGLQSNIFWRNSYFKSADGQLFFGGDNGINAFYPENIIANPQVPPVVITGVSLFNQPLQVDFSSQSPLRFEHNENFISFDFVALDFTDPEQNQYAYRLEGLDEDWIWAGNRRHADYPGLLPGDYIFRVLGSNHDGVWNEYGAALSITITPPFWQTAWFVGLGLTALVGSGYGVYRLRLRSLEQRGRELEAEVEVRTSELQETNLQLEQAMQERERAEEALAKAAAQAAVREERDRLARDLHDSVTQSIYSTTLLAEAGQRHVAGGDLEQSHSTFLRLSQITQQALKEMRLMVYELRPVALENVGLVEALQGRLDAVERRAGVDARLIIGEDLTVDGDYEAALYFLAQEALNNAMKHAAPQRVGVHLDASESGGCRLTITDDGVGFDPGAVEGSGGLGLVSMRERVEALHGAFSLESAPGSGTTISVTLPPKSSGELL